jgi:hypothetical protein
VLLIHRRMSGEPPWDEFALRHPDLLAWSPSILDRYYRQETLKSERARREFVAPDGENSSAWVEMNVSTDRWSPACTCHDQAAAAPVSSRLT